MNQFLNIILNSWGQIIFAMDEEKNFFICSKIIIDSQLVKKLKRKTIKVILKILFYFYFFNEFDDLSLS